jgi:hypothetical protein
MTTVKRRPWISFLLLSIFRLMVLHIPFYSLLAAYTTTRLIQHVSTNYWSVQVNELFVWNEERRLNENTYFGRICTTDDATAKSPVELLANTTAADAVHGMLQHGVQLFPNLIRPDTAAALRETIIDYNDKVDNFDVIENENRNSYGILVDQHPSVRQAIHEILSNPLLQEAIPKIMGDDPAIYKFHAITSSVGAEDQHWHYDVVTWKAAGQYVRSFVPIYSLFIPLQNTTEDMGATQMCPGSHVCSAGTSFCDDASFVMAGPGSGLPNDEWPAGWGALMNQQTTHRGRAHRNHTSGPRVLFILAFAPRPHSEHETRSLSLGGSYAQHWTQWGHTVSDLRDSWTHMKWRLVTFLRSMGIWKWPNWLSRTGETRSWGWTWPTIVLIQMANGDYYDEDELESYLEKDWFSKSGYFPFRWLLADLPDESECKNREIVWFCWFEATLERTSKWLKSILVGMSAHMLLFSPLLAGKGRRIRALFRSFVLPLMVVYLAHSMIQRHIDNSTWHRKIKSHEMFSPFRTFVGPVLKATLPTNEDVLMMHDYQSEYLASYSQLYDVAHPGNLAWRVSIAESSNGYQYLSDNLQSVLCTSVMKWNKHYRHSRILTKNHQNEWAEVPESIGLEFTHSQLLRQDNAVVEHLMRQVDFLLSETKFGRMWQTSMSTIHSRSMIRSLQLLLLGMKKEAGAPQKSSPRHVKRVGSFLPTIPTAKKDYITEKNGRIGIPPMPPATEPFHGAWLNVGDIVDARYKSEYNEWYKGVIVGVQAFEGWYTVRHLFDGALDERLCRHCVRPFEEYRIGETIDYLVQHSYGSEGLWQTATIRDVIAPDTYRMDIADENSKTSEESHVVRSNAIRRFSNYDEDEPVSQKIKLGEFVEVRHAGGWQIGVVCAKKVEGDVLYYGVEIDELDLYEDFEGEFVRPLWIESS